MLKIKKLSVFYKKFQALDIQKEISIVPGDKIGIIGSNGSGKTTLIKALLGLVTYEGLIETNLKEIDMAVHMQQNDYMDTIRINTIFDALLTKQQLKSEQFLELLNYFDFKKNLHKRFSQLSGGEKQRFTIILVIMQNRKLNIFDEVTTGLDFETRTRLMDKLANWYKNKDAGLILVTHYYEELEKLTNKLLMLHEGKVIDFDDKAVLFKKYCGYSVIMYEDDQKITFPYKKLIAPKAYTAISCGNIQEEMEIIQTLNKNNINFKRTNKDIELVYLNALGRKQHEVY